MSPSRPLASPWRVPVSTYRLQLNHHFTFEDAAGVVEYLHDLGVTDCYTSPVLSARAGSQHGYDISDHQHLNPELGGATGYATLVSALRAHDMGHLLDVVPNHMGIDARGNAWWRDVLENGPSSPYADFFDIDWSPVKRELWGKVLLPILGDQYGLVLERGELHIAFSEGRFSLRYFEHDLPVNPRQVPRIFQPRLEALRRQRGDDDPEVREFLSILTALGNLPGYTERDPQRVEERQREKEVARERLARLTAASPAILAFIDEAVAACNGEPGRPSSFDALHELLEAQAYRLAYWRTAFDEINYRRFFDVNDLAGLRMEDPRVFEATHGLVLQLAASGAVSGLRIDHPDGLALPKLYFDRLQEAIAAARGSQEPCYVIVEKILSGAETLPTEWAVHGTTGYDFLNLVNGVWVDEARARDLDRVHSLFTDVRERPADTAYESKRTIMRTSMASELNVLAHALNVISEGDRRSRDFTLDTLRKTLLEIVACFAVYRTYVTRDAVSQDDRRVVDAALAEMRRRNPVTEPSILEFVRQSLLAPDHRDSTETPARAAQRVDFALKFQQYTGPVQAKGIEDTAFYRNSVLISLNEVGADPASFGVDLAAFHAANEQRLARWPLGMITTATHDTKRGEDARARISVISEVPDEWRRHVSLWARLNRGLHSLVAGRPAPDRNDEYLFYQSLVGAWPAERIDAPVPPCAPDEFVERLTRFMRKAIKEAKVHSSWVSEDEAYEAAMERFIVACLTGHGAGRFLAAFVPMARRVAQAGVVNALAQLAIKLTAPGVPDTYQGGELWDFSLVDPDNRRPVDFELRKEMLAELGSCLQQAAKPFGDGDVAAGRSPGVDGDQHLGALRAAAHEWLSNWHDGRVKMFVSALGLRLRRAQSPLFLEGSYLRLASRGNDERRVVAFARRHASTTLVTVVPRLTGSFVVGSGAFPVAEPGWGDATLTVPVEPGTRFINLVTGENVVASPDEGASAVRLAQVFATVPIAWLWSRTALTP